MIVTLRTLDASGAEVARPIEIEPIPDSRYNLWRVVAGERRARCQQRYNDQRSARRRREGQR